MIGDLLGSLVGGWFGGAAGRRNTRRRAGRLDAVGRAEIALHVIRGSVPGLRLSWRHGVAALAPGRLELVSYRGGLRFLRRKPVTVDVTGVDLATRRTPAGAEHVSLHPSCDIVVIRSGAATLELAVPAPYRLDRVLERLGLT